MAGIRFHKHLAVSNGAMFWFVIIWFRAPAPPRQYLEEVFTELSDIILDFLRLFKLEKYAKGKDAAAFDADKEAAAAAREGVNKIVDLQHGHHGKSFVLEL